jgi:hypothetical protein
VAKRKTAGASKAKSANGAKRKSATAGNSPASEAKSKTKADLRPMTGAEIGHVAGKVWAALEKNGGQTLAEIKKSVDAPADLVAAAVGWLAREDKLEFRTSGTTVKIGLR